MLALGCILIGLGLGLILENLQEAIEFSLVGLIVGSFLYTKLGIYIKLNANKTKKTIIYIMIGVLIGIIVGFITQEFIGSIIMGVGCAIVSLNLSNYRRFRRNNGNRVKNE